MTVYGLYIFKCLMFLLKHREKFEPFTKEHLYNTRRQIYIFPSQNYSKTQSSVTYACIRLHNALPEAVKRITDKNKFKTCIKSFVIKLEPYSLAEYYHGVSDMSLYNM